MKTFLLNDCVGIFTLGKMPLVVWKSGTRVSRCCELLDIGAGNQNLVSWEISKDSEQQSLFSSPISTCPKTLINIQTVELPWNIIKNFGINENISKQPWGSLDLTALFALLVFYTESLSLPQGYPEVLKREAFSVFIMPEPEIVCHILEMSLNLTFIPDISRFQLHAVY